MRKTIIAGGVAALSLALAGGVALAQQGPSQAPAHRGDVDADGRISQAEFLQQHLARHSGADADHDGMVATPEAQAAMQARRAERMTARFDQLDTDRNGSISRAEFEARHADRGGRGHGRHGRGGDHMGAREPVSAEQAQARAIERFTRLDTDRDGYLTAEERRAGHQGRGGWRGRQASQAAPAAE